MPGLLEEVRETRQPIRVVRDGKPVAEVVPPALNRADWIGSMKDSMVIKGDIISPASDEDEWEVLRDGVFLPIRTIKTLANS